MSDKSPSDSVPIDYFPTLGDTRPMPTYTSINPQSQNHPHMPSRQFDYYSTPSYITPTYASPAYQLPPNYFPTLDRDKQPTTMCTSICAPPLPLRYVPSTHQPPAHVSPQHIYPSYSPQHIHPSYSPTYISPPTYAEATKPPETLYSCYKRRQDYHLGWKSRAKVEEEDDYVSSYIAGKVVSRIDTSVHPASKPIEARDLARLNVDEFVAICCKCNIKFLKRSVLESNICGPCYRQVSLDQQYVPKECECVNIDCLNRHEKAMQCVLVDNYGGSDVCSDCGKKPVRLYARKILGEYKHTFGCSVCIQRN